jgi:protein phosphatase
MQPLIFTAQSVASERHPERNEDSFLADQQSGLAGVFDGVGVATQATFSASQMAARVFLQEWKQFILRTQPGHTFLTLGPQETSIDLKATLSKMAEKANSQIRATHKRRIFHKAERQATTMALAALCRRADTEEYLMTYVSVGDSRIYLLREQRALTCLTRDDGYLTSLVKRQTITEADALRIDQATHPDQLSETELSYFKKRTEIFQMLGASSITIQSDQTSIMPGDHILLCSDGIHDNLTHNEIEEVLKQSDPTTLAHVLVERALERSREASNVRLRAKPDDMTAVVITHQR